MLVNREGGGLKVRGREATETPDKTGGLRSACFQKPSSGQGKPAPQNHTRIVKR